MLDYLFAKCLQTNIVFRNPQKIHSFSFQRDTPGVKSIHEFVKMGMSSFSNFSAVKHSRKD